MTSQAIGSSEGGFGLGEHREALTRSFVGLVLIATCLPFVLVPLVMETSLLTEGRAMLIFGALLVTGAHQQSSWYLYVDRDSRKIAFSHPLFFFVGPLAIAAASVGFFVYLPTGAHPYFWIAWGVLALHHYQKQNLGMFGLLAPAVSGERMDSADRWLIQAGGYCGMLVFGYPLSRSMLEDTPLVSLEPALWWVAAAGILGLGLLTLVRAWRPALFGIDRVRPPLQRTLMLLFLVTFYWPLLLIENPLTAFAMVACAHGLQYFVIMSFVAAGSDRARELAARRRGLAGLLSWRSSQV